MHSLDTLLHDLTELDTPLKGVQVSGLASHSDAVQAGNLYLAVPGHQVHGLDFLETAITRGACAVAWDADDDQALRDCPIPSVFVPGLCHKVGIIADRFFDHPSATLQVIAITGTNGKTSTAHFISEALSQKYSGCGLIGTLGSGIFGSLKKTANTTPDGLFLHKQMQNLCKKDIRHVVLEASSHGLVQGRLAGVQVDVAVLTIFGRDHFDYHGSAQAYKEAKKLLFKVPSLHHVILNIDDELGQELAEMCRNQCKLITYSAGNSVANVVAHNIEVTCDGLRFELRYINFTAQIQSNLIGRFNVTNLLATFSVLLTQGVDPESAAQMLCEVQQIKGRMEPFTVPQSSVPLVILDYAHTPEALASVLQTCAEITQGDLYCVFGCGGDRDQGKRKIMGEVASQLAHYVVLTDDNPRYESPPKIIADILQGMEGSPEKSTVIHDRREAIQVAISRAQRNDCVLVAGKGHETVQIVQGKSLPLNDTQIITEALAEAC